MYILRFQEPDKHKKAVDWIKSNKIVCWVIHNAALEIHLFSKEEAQNLAKHLRETGFKKDDITVALTKDEPEFPDGIGWLEQLWDSPTDS